MHSLLSAYVVVASLSSLVVAKSDERQEFDSRTKPHVVLILAGECCLPGSRRPVLLSAHSSHISAQPAPLADDYGHSNLGYNHAPISNTSTPHEIQASREAHTPILDGLMKGGTPLSRHYAYKICSPSRSALQSGRLPTHVNYHNTGVLVHNKLDPISGYQGIPRNVTGIAEKMKQGGYRTHMVGKWDAGMATPDHTPGGKGYDSFFGYFQHANQYWNKKGGIKATGDVDVCLNRFTDLMKENATYRGGVLEEEDLDESCSGSDDEDPSCYEEHLFKREGLKIIQSHAENSPEDPLFYFHSFHLLHTPLNVPNSYLKKVDEVISPFTFDSASRRNYSAMALYMDNTVGELVDELKTQGMWNNTLLAFVTDNGGPLYLPGSSNNHPLKGGKYSDWEGGIRTNAFLAGGWLDERRETEPGTAYDGVVSIADFYGMFANLAGVDLEDEKAEDANRWLKTHRPGLPRLAKVDAVDGLIDDIILGKEGINEGRKVLQLSDVAILKFPYKLVQGLQPYSGHTGLLYPNCSTITSETMLPWHNDSHIFDDVIPWSHDIEELNTHLWAEDCGFEPGCLFNVDEDPNERNDLADADEFKEIGSELKKLLEEANKSNFNPNRGKSSEEGCNTALKNGGYLGPFIEIENYYTGPFRQFTEQKEKLVEPFSDLLDIVNSRIGEAVVEEVTKAIYPDVIRPKLVESFDYCIESGTPGLESE